ncbi:RNA polymerase sigma factor [Kitasatospora sp. NPDC003701]
MVEDRTTELLVVRCQLGEREAFGELVGVWHDALRRYLRGMTGSGHVADDLAQETWVAVLRGLPRLRQPDRFAPWLFTIGRRALADHLRRACAAPVLTVLEEADDALSGEPAGVAEVLDRMEIEAGLDGLPPLEREVLLLFHLQDLPLTACAAVLDVPVGTVKSRLSRARRMLRAVLTEKGYHA